jgi:hypothetical protein
MTAHVETPSEYTRRLLSYVEGKDPIEVLGTTATRFRTIVRATPPDLLRRHPAPEKWSIVQILAHLADSEIVGSYRTRLILAHDGVAVQPFD